MGRRPFLQEERFTMKRVLVASVVSGLTVAMGVVAANPASASQCSGSRTFTKVSNDSITFKQASGNNSSVTGGPGVTLTISKSTSFTVGGSITKSADVGVDLVIASIKSSLGVTVQASRTGTSSTSGAWKVPSSYKVGRLAIGANKYKGTVTKYLENKGCVNVKLGSSAKYNAPKKEWHFKTSKVS